MAYTPFDDLQSADATTVDTSSQTFSASGQEVIQLDNNDFIADSQMTKDGYDLVLEAPDGSVVVIEGYFLAEPAPVLQGPNGSALTPELVDSFAKAPAEFAKGSSLTDESPVGTIEELSGEATVTRADGTVEAIQLGTPIYEGDIIETSADGAVNIVFIDETSFAISENARMAIDEYVFDPATESGSQNFSVLRGVFVFTSGLIGRDDPDDVEIDTPVGSIGIRGTIIAGNINPDGDSEITVIEGAIVVKNAGGEKTLSTQFETVKLTSYDSGMEDVGVLDANTVGQNYGGVQNVAPSLFSAINDSAQDQQQQQDNSSQDASGSSDDAQSGEPEPAPEDGPVQQEPAQDTSGEEAQLTTEPKPEPIMEFAEESFDGSNSTFDGGSTETQTTVEATTKTTTTQTQQTTTQEPVPTQQTSTQDQPAPIVNNTNQDTGPVPPLELKPTSEGVTVIRDSGVQNRIGASITAGDFDNDGFSDLLFTNDTNRSSPTQHHHYLLEGSASQAADVMGDLSSLIESHSTPGGDYHRDVVANIGDIDGDGEADFATGFRFDTNGSTDSGSVIINASTAGLVEIGGIMTAAHMGRSVDGIGDINRDGFDDVIMNSPGASEAYIKLGGATISDNTDFTFSTGINLNSDVAGAGDFNGDGFLDVVVGESGTGSGKATVHFGDGVGGFSGSVAFTGLDTNDSGDVDLPIISLGDINADGRDDLMMASIGTNTIHVVLGGSTSGDVNTKSLFDVQVIGGGSAGDFNGDGINDFVLATLPTSQGNSNIYLVYGRENWGGITLDNNFLENSSNAFKMILGGVDQDDQLTITSGGDMNGDGFDELVIGHADFGNDPNAAVDENMDNIYDNDTDGRVTIVYGRETNVNVLEAQLQDPNATPSPSSNRAYATATADGQSIVGSSHYDTIRDDGHSNLSMKAGASNDYFGISIDAAASHRLIDGGGGIDTIVFGGENKMLDFSTLNNLNGIERITNTQMDSNAHFKLSVNDIFDLFAQSSTGEFFIMDSSSDGSGILTINSASDHADTVAGIEAALQEVAPGADHVGDIIIESKTYEKFEIGGNTLYIHNEFSDNLTVA